MARATLFTASLSWSLQITLSSLVYNGINSRMLSLSRARRPSSDKSNHISTACNIRYLLPSNAMSVLSSPTSSPSANQKQHTEHTSNVTQTQVSAIVYTYKSHMQVIVTSTPHTRTMTKLHTAVAPASSQLVAITTQATGVHLDITQLTFKQDDKRSNG